jgi:hypothetical protein
MKRSSWSRKTTFSLSGSMHQQLSAYALAANAAGVGLLTLAQPSEAKIVYTATHRVISPGKSYDLDLNHDGITDFTLLNHHMSTTSGFKASFYAEPGPSNAVQGHIRFGRNSAFALDRGARIGSKRPFPLGRASLAYSTFFLTRGYRGGSWFNVTNRFLGLKFKIHGKTHYGWARLSITVNSKISGTLTGYAYETIPGKGLVAGQTKGMDDSNIEQLDAALTAPVPDSPQPPTLGTLAMGAPGLSIWRRKDSVAATPERN